MAGVLKYLSFQGRANRKRYWLTVLSIWVLFFVSALFVGALSALPLLSLIIIPVWLALLVATIANGARRLHDREKSAWWLLVFSVLPCLLLIPAELAKFGSDEGFQAFAALFALFGLPFSIWGLVVMGFLKGTPGPNRYGENPLSPKIEEAFA
jgi:uncharacterized membrane protein YhaH (DUF805 family)